MSHPPAEAMKSIVAHGNVPGRWWALLAAGMLCAVARAADPALVVAGGPDDVWILRDMTGGEGPQHRWRLTYRRAGRSGQAFWAVPLQDGEVTGNLRHAVMRGAHLHVWYADGTHRYYTPRRSSVGRTLPESAVPLAVAAGDADSPMYAVVERSVADALPPQPPAASAETTAEPVDETTHGVPAPEREPATAVAEPRWPASKYVVVRLERGQWQGDRGLPESWFNAVNDVHLLAGGVKLTVVFSTGDAAQPYRYSVSNGPEEPWSPPAQIAGPTQGSLLAAAMCGDQPTLAVSRDGGASVVPMSLADGTWTVGSPLKFGADPPRSVVRAAFSRAGDRLVGAWVTTDDTVQVAQWSIRGGPPAATPAPVRPLTRGPTAQSWNWGRMMLTYVILALVLTVVFFRRRASVMVRLELPAHHQLAPHGRRLMAFAIDALLFAPAVAYLYEPLLREFDFNETLLRQAALSDVSVMRDFTGRWVIAVAAFIAYAIVFEGAWGATPGKRLTHLRVIDEHGGRARWAHVIVRNVCRGVEFFPFFDLMPTLVLVFLTRNHQRLGDLIGGTVVIHETAPPGLDTSTASEEPKDPEDPAA